MVGVASEALSTAWFAAGVAGVADGADAIQRPTASDSRPVRNFDMFDASDFVAFERDEWLYNKIRWRSAKFRARTFAIISTRGARRSCSRPRVTRGT